MKLLRNTISLLALIVISTVAISAQQQTDAPLTNAAVVKLVRAGFKEKTVITIINSRPNRFELGPDRLIELKRSGVSENIILAMLAQVGVEIASDDFSSDPFFRDTPNSSQRNPSSNGTDIFGSGGESSSQKSGRGMRGSGQEETTTTGSATVRIVRPPSESGGPQLKLEKTPTLTNDSIIQLVDAGFSEGTIIKRIENSPAEYDLSQAKVQELRKRRVSEPIIAAMTAAMQDSSDPNRSNPGGEN